MLTEFQNRVARVVLAAAEPYGFALGGGQALGAHGIVDRMSADIDSYADSTDPDDYANAEAAIITALVEDGLAAETVKEDSWLRVFVVSDLSSGDKVVFDLGYDSRSKPPVRLAGIGNVLDIDDVVYGKVRAFVDRQYARDFVDIDAILRDGRWTVAGLYSGVRPIRAEEVPTPSAFAVLLESAHLGDPFEYTQLGLSPDDMIAMFGRLDQQAGGLRAAGATTKITPRSVPVAQVHRPPGLGGGQFMSPQNSEPEITLDD